MNRARARTSAIALGAVAVALPALGCTFIVQFQNPGGEEDAAAQSTVDATTTRDAGRHADSGTKPDTGDASLVNDAAGDDDGNDDDASEDAAPLQMPDADMAAIYAHTGANTVTLGALTCDPCSNVARTGWTCAHSIPTNQCQNQGSLLLYCSGDGGPMLATQNCGGIDCATLANGFAGICSPCGSCAVCFGHGPAFRTTMTRKTLRTTSACGFETPLTSGSEICTSTNCTTGCGVPSP